jgi:hypothetical protein
MEYSIIPAPSGGSRATRDNSIEQEPGALLRFLARAAAQSPLHLSRQRAAAANDLLQTGNIRRRPR